MTSNDRKCKNCNKTTEHTRFSDQYAGELWVCESCGHKTIRDESESWSKVTPDYEGSRYDELYEQDMKSSRYRSIVGFIAMFLAGHDTSGRFTAAEKLRIAHVVVRNWDKSEDEIATELKSAGFNLEGMMASPAKQVADIKSPCTQQYDRKMRKKWWQFWK